MFKSRKLTVFSFLMILALSLSLVVGCGKQEPSAPEEQAQEQQAPEVDANASIREAADKYYAKMPDHMYKISEDDVKALYDSKELADYLVLDITGNEHYGQGHIEGAIDVPFAEVGKNLDLIATNAKGKKGVIVACFTGQTAGQTVALLNMSGIPARSLNLGMELGWKAKGYPVVAEPTEAKVAESYDWGNKAPIKEAVEKYFDKMAPEGMFANYKISQDDLKAQLESNPEKYLVVDIRGHEENAKGSITADALDIPFKEVNNYFDEIAEKAKGKTVVVACYTGQTAGQTDAVLNLLGIKTVSLNRGINAGWVEEKGFELVQ